MAPEGMVPDSCEVTDCPAARVPTVQVSLTGVEGHPDRGGSGS